MELAEGVPVGIGTSQEGSLEEATLGVGTWPKASGPGSPMLGGPSSHREAEEKALGVAGACQGRRWREGAMDRAGSGTSGGGQRTQKTRDNEDRNGNGGLKVWAV